MRNFSVYSIISKSTLCYFLPFAHICVHLSVYFPWRIGKTLVLDLLRMREFLCLAGCWQILHPPVLNKIYLQKIKTLILKCLNIRAINLLPTAYCCRMETWKTWRTWKCHWQIKFLSHITASDALPSAAIQNIFQHYLIFFIEIFV